jgi:hypothetical protein
MTGHIIRPRRRFLQLAALGGDSAALAGAGSFAGPSFRDAWFRVGNALADSLYIEAFPTSPLILNPFTDPLPIPKALAPVPTSVVSTWANRPGPGMGMSPDGTLVITEDPSAGARSGRGTMWTVPYIP